jgi:uncharacterized protein
MKTKFMNKKFPYDGSQLRPLYAYEQFKVMGHSIISWIGPCSVSLDKMIDLEDKIVESKITGDLMLHFIVEIFDCHLMTAVSLQRLLAAQILELLSSQLKGRFPLAREGDDIYWVSPSKKLKLSISIASRSAVSSQIHFALNIVNTGTPVPTCSLGDFKIEPVAFAKKVMAHFSSEFESITAATQKVYPL